MSWFSSALHSIGILPKGPSDAEVAAINAQTEATKTATATAKAAADAALKAQTDANLLAQANSVPTIDSESARGASDDELRKRINGSGFGIGLPTEFGAAPVGFRVLAGQ